MSGTEKSSSTGWSEPQKYELLLRIVNQLSKSGKPDWNSMEMPGRTPKALSHQWSRIQKEMSNLDSGNDSGAASTSATSTPKGKKGVAAGKRAAKATGGTDADDEGSGGVQSPAKPKAGRKRTAATSASDGTAKKRRAPAKKAEAPQASNEESPDAKEEDDEVPPFFDGEVEDPTSDN